MRRIKCSFRYVLPLCILFILIGLWVFDKFENESINTRGYASTQTNELNMQEHLVDSDIVDNIIDKTRKKIRTELSNYYFNDSGVSKLEDLLMESGGNPIRSIVVSSWRSGSTFLGDLLNSMPGNFYHYEPFLRHKINQIRGPPHGDKTIEDIKKMLKCNFKDMDEYFEYGKTDPEQFSFNSRIWEYCEYNKELCYDEKFMGKFCKQFPFQSMKLTRVRLPLFEQFLKEKELNAKIVLLVRDPRGLMQSRQHRTFCVKSPDCWNLKIVCDDMTNDYKAVTRLMKTYPNQIMTLRFEDLALNVYNTTRHLFKFLRLGFTYPVVEFLQSHTDADVAGVSSTIRITRDVPFKWKKILYFHFVQQIQVACEEAMNLWGYEMAHNETHMRSEDFNPLKPYFLI